MAETTPAVNASNIEALRRDLDRLERWVTRLVIACGSVGGGAVLILLTAMLKGSGLI